MDTKFLSVAGGRIAYEEQGSGPLVVCTPSMGDLRAEYRLLVPQLVAAGYRVVSVDLRGLGESSVGWNNYSAAAVGSDLVALLRHLDEPAILIGCSMAAGASAWAAAEVPTLVRGLVLIGPFVRDLPQSFFTKLLLRVLFVRLWGVSAWLSYYNSLYPTRKPADFADYRARLGANLRESGRFAALQQMLRASKGDVEARLAQVNTPTLVVMGTKDPDFKDQQAEAELVAQRLHGSVQMIAGAGHYPHAEMPEQVGPLLIKFMQEQVSNVR